MAGDTQTPGVDDVLTLSVGGSSRAEWEPALDRAGVRVNASAERLFDHPRFDAAPARAVGIVVRSVAELGMADGATLVEILERARQGGLDACAPVTGVYLRLAMLDQVASADSVMSNGRAPDGSITVASWPLEDDSDFPKGLYLRVVDGVPWLRGYRCDDDHVWSPDDRFAFAVAACVDGSSTGR